MTTVWKFTNKKELNKSEFVEYIERKVFRTIRKYQMLSKNRIIILEKSGDLNTAVLKNIIETKFKVSVEKNPNLSSENLSQVAEDIFNNILNGKFDGPSPNDKPLYYLSDKEIELYAKLKNIKGDTRIKRANIQNLFKKFIKKNQDLELNIIRALSQINKSN